MSCVLVAAVMLLFNRRLALAIAFVVTFRHSVAAAAWAARAGTRGVLVAMALLVVVERLVAVSWRAGNLCSA
jgi:hypothetical protein